MKKNSLKQSSIGQIPYDWKVKEIEDLVSEISNGATYDPDSSSGYPITRIETIADGSINIEKVGLTPFTESLEKFKLKKGDILYSHINSVAHIGKTAYCEKDFDILHGMNLLRLKPKPNINSKLFYYLLNSKYARKQAYCAAKRAVNQASLSTNEIRQFKLPIPSTEEQQKIAAILSTWDTAISKTQQLIDQLKERNRGLQQTLLTGKKRLTGFNGKWNYFPLSKFSKEVSKKNTDNKDLIVLSCTKYKGLVSSLEYFGKQIFSKDISTYKIVPKNCFAYATNHIEEGSIGLQLDYEEALISPMYTVFKTDISLFDNTFLYKVLKSHNYIHEYQKRMEGSIDRRGGLRWDEFSKIKIPVISIEEQKAILNILNNADNEVLLQEQKLETLKQQKKGLMQKLLTGRIRV